MTSSVEKTLERKALTLAVVCVEQRVEQLRAEWNKLSAGAQARMPGLEGQLVNERAALRWLKARREEAYR